MKPHHAWHRVLFVGAKTHAVPGCLRADLIADMATRDVVLDARGLSDRPPVKRINEWALDMGGAMITTEPKVDLCVDNLPMSMLCGQALDILDAVRKSPARTFASGRPYHKVHGRWHCLVLTPRQHRNLTAEVERVAAESHERWRSFFAAWSAQVKQRAGAWS